MAQVIPTKKTDQLQWFKDHAPVWEERNEAIGLTLMQALEFTSASDTASEAYAAYLAAKQALENASLDLDNKLDVALDLARGYVKIIKSKAINNPAVYQLANISPPAPPTPAPAPSVPTEVKGEVANCGAIRLTWKGSTNGVFYNIFRRAAGEGQFKLIKAVGARKFLDSTVPSGAMQVEYVLMAQRGERTSPLSEPIVVSLSCGAQAQPLKMLKAA